MAQLSIRQLLLAPARLMPVRAATPATRYLWITCVCSVALFALLALALLGWLPPLYLLAAVPLLYVRLALALHELMHLRSANQVPFYHRICLLLDTPLALGYAALRAVHLRHHRWNAGERDPELYQIAAGPVRALAAALLTPELQLLQWLKQHAWRTVLTPEAVLRCLVFVAVASINPPVFAVYWLCLRASIGVSGFVFHHLLHYRNGALGTYALPVGPGLRRVGSWLFGQEPMLILTRHRAHHLWPHLRIHQLPDLPEDFTLAPRPCTAQDRMQAFLSVTQTQGNPP